MRRTLCLTLVATMFVATSGVPVHAETSESEVVGIRLVPHPDQQDMGRRGIVSIVAEVEPGSSIEREVVVSNNTSQEKTLEVYVGGASIQGSDFAPDDDPDHPVARWATVSPGQVTLAPGEEQSALVRLAVPVGASGGEHYGVAWVQPPASDGPIQQVNRVGVRIYLSVAGSESPPVEDAAEVTDFIIESMTAVTLQNSRRQVQIEVRNTGQRAVDLVGQLELSDGPSGLSAGPFPTDGVTTLAIGAPGQVTVTLDSELPVGPWLARAELSTGSVERAAEATITFPETDTGQPQEAAAEMTEIENQRRVLIPTTIMLLVIALVIMFVMLLGKRRDREEEDAASPPETSTVADDSKD